MFVDSRVAHWKAKEALRVVTSDPAVMRRKISATLATTVQSGTMSKRDFRRRLENKILPMLEKLGVTASISQRDGETFVTCSALCGNEKAGAAFIFVRLDSATLRIHDWEPVRVTPHAIARCLQRNGVEKWSEIESEIWGALAAGQVFANQAYGRGWIQVGVPTRRGLFVGAYDRAVHSITLHTYFKPGANGRPSRWDNYLALIGDVPDFGFTAGSLSSYIEWMSALYDQMGAEERFDTDAQFLKTPYVRAEDPHDAAWQSSHRDRAAAE